MPLIRGIKHASLRVSMDDSVIGASCSQTAATSSSSSVVEDIDAFDADECIVEYVADVISDLKQKERQQCALLRELPSSVERDRGALLQWMLTARKTLSLRVDTYALAVGILDRYTNVELNRRRQEALPFDNAANENNNDNIISAEHAIGALLLAATLEETFPPETGDMFCLYQSAVKNNECVKRLFHVLNLTQLRNTRSKMAVTLNFDLWTVTWLHFLRRFSKASRSSSKQHNRSKALCSLMTQNYTLFVLPYRPSQLAAAAIMRMRQTMLPNEKCWSRTLTHYTGYERAEIEPIVNKMTF